MANPYFGNVGDVWKHLVLAEILGLERPRSYCESHSGSASYPAEDHARQRCDFHDFVEHARLSPSLAESQYFRVLEEQLGRGRYPGSPLVALLVLGGAGTGFAFADIDRESLDTIAGAATECGIAPERLQLSDRDGIVAIDAFIRNGSSATLAFIDPFDAFARSEGGLSSIDALRAAGEHGAKAVLWYPIFSTEMLAPLHEALPAGAWVADIMLSREIAPIDGLVGCGVCAVNLSPHTTTRCGDLGASLAEAMPEVTFVGGQP